MASTRPILSSMVDIDAVAMLRNIRYRAEMPLSELATKGTEKELLRQLIERGFVERYQISPKRMRYRITEEGKELHIHMEWIVSALGLADEVIDACMRNHKIYHMRSSGELPRDEEDLRAMLEVIGSRVSDEVAQLETPPDPGMPDYMYALIEDDLKGLLPEDDVKDTDGEAVVRDTVTAEDLAKGPQQPPAGMLARDIVEDPITNEPLSVVEYHKKYGAFPTDDVRVIKRTGDYRGGSPPPQN